ncbi:Aste57867_22822 [Aphanomyces stellatus]|uniref:Aste57867_22822 protein n=1 Tax=Aphanomyces stellatus TaxID=120398 RepID=A0A485LKZ0_9STRA|nr:hypothetical protein As57867_022752 [Aphanomyces stellatus]VFT99473.1 Aste57867_22822 [Aphanomyces stellatus]
MLALCQPPTDTTDAVDLVCFVVGRELHQAVPMLEALQAIVGPCVIIVGGDADDKGKTEAVASECKAHGALYFAALPVKLVALRTVIQRALERGPHTYIFRRKQPPQEKPLTILFNALHRRNGGAADVIADPAAAATTGHRSWFKPKGHHLPSLADMNVFADHAADKTRDTHMIDDTHVWHPPIQASSFATGPTMLSSLPIVTSTSLVHSSLQLNPRSSKRPAGSNRSSRSSARSSQRSTTTRGYESDF